MSELKPIKRSVHLAPLSREHHEGLLFVWKIRTGLKNGTSLENIAYYSRWFWQNHLEEHFRKEEEVLAPLADRGNNWLLRMFEEHQQIRKMIIAEGLAGESTLKKLATTIDDHIRFEERLLFPYLEKEIPAGALEQIHELLSKENKAGSAWTQEFWLKK